MLLYCPYLLYLAPAQVVSVFHKEYQYTDMAVEYASKYPTDMILYLLELIFIQYTHIKCLQDAFKGISGHVDALSLLIVDIYLWKGGQRD